MISIEVNGRTIAQHTESVPPPPYARPTPTNTPRTPLGGIVFEEEYLCDDAGDDVNMV